jgi:ABC-type uncharacterized transport system substrate-binding protein
MQFDRLKRREFITLLGGAAVAWPVAARAQPGERMRRIGVLVAPLDSDREAQRWISALREGLEKLGWNDGRNVRIDVRWGAGDAQRLRASAVELVGSKPDVIVAGGGSAVERLKQATQTIPVVFAAASDPVGGGFVASVARPGGNITGFALYEYSIVAKWLELLKQLAPSINRVAVLYDPNDPTNRGQLPEIASWALALAVQSSTFSVRNAAEITDTIDAFANKANGGLVVLPNPVAVVQSRTDRCARDEASATGRVSLPFPCSERRLGVLRCGFRRPLPRRRVLRRSYSQGGKAG